MFVFVPGSIRESGGAFGKREAALEEQYFHKIQAQQIDDLKKHHADEIEFHKREIARHQVTHSSIQLVILRELLRLRCTNQCHFACILQSGDVSY